MNFFEWLKTKSEHWAIQQQIQLAPNFPYSEGETAWFDYLNHTGASDFYFNELELAIRHWKEDSAETNVKLAETFKVWWTIELHLVDKWLVKLVENNNPDYLWAKGYVEGDRVWIAGEAVDYENGLSTSNIKASSKNMDEVLVQMKAYEDQLIQQTEEAFIEATKPCPFDILSDDKVKEMKNCCAYAGQYMVRALSCKCECHDHRSTQ